MEEAHRVSTGGVHNIEHDWRKVLVWGWREGREICPGIMEADGNSHLSKRT